MKAKVTEMSQSNFKAILRRFKRININIKMHYRQASENKKIWHKNIEKAE